MFDALQGMAETTINIWRQVGDVQRKSFSDAVEATQAQFQLIGKVNAPREFANEMYYHELGRQASTLLFGALKILDCDDPVTIRARKYVTGTHVILREIDVETAAAPRDVVWTKNKARLYRYRRADGGDGGRRPVPVLLTYGFVLKPYVFDLTPGNSVVQNLVEAGFDVYMLDFGVPGQDDAGLAIEDLVLDYLHGAVQKAIEISGAAEISLLGHSQGGTLSVMYASLFPDGPLKNLVLLSAPTEFAPRNPEPIGLWTYTSRNGGAMFDPVIVPMFLGNLPTGLASDVLDLGVSWMANGAGTVCRSFSFGGYDVALRQIRDQAGRDVAVRSWLAACKWVDDAAPFPGETFRTWIEDLYQRDELVRGKVKLRGRTVDLSNIRCAVFNVSGKWDYVVPPSQTKATTALARSSVKESITLDAGHVGMFIGPAAADRLWPRLGNWLEARSGN
ncbi:MAG: alpha/beta fold hydrolase [Pseudomonadota bacterium]|nr:alpha/beta fold hydrolase [Pseudomonadota bacterium]